MKFAVIDCTNARRAIDVGGGLGALLSRLMTRYPQLAGTLVDLPHNIAAARPRFAAAGLLQRADLVAGDFFSTVPSGGDVYILKRVLHDWDDEKARSILRTCRAAMDTHARLVVIEHVVAPGNAPSHAKWLDLLMLVYAGGRERTAAEFDALLSSAAFRLTSISEVGLRMSVIEAAVAEYRRT
jgi:hypothetical protein